MYVRFRWNVFTQPLLRNGRLFIRLLRSNGCTRCLFRGLCLATGLYATIWIYRDQLLKIRGLNYVSQPQMCIAGSLVNQCSPFNLRLPLKSQEIINRRMSVVLWQNWFDQEVKLYILRYTNILILVGMTKNFSSSRRSPLFHLFMRVVQLIK
jgi:hypothetical protein